MTIGFANGMRVLLLAICVGFAGSAAPLLAQDTPETVEAPADTAQPEIIATIGRKVLTVQELIKEFANRGTNFGPDLAVAQQRLRDTVIAEYWVDQNFAQLAVRDPRAALALGEARRQVLFEIYAQSTFPREEVTEEDIAGYVAENPNIFENRRSYVYQRTLVIAGDEAKQDAARQALAGITEAGDTPSDFAPFAKRLAAAGVDFAVTRNWTSNENLSNDLQPRLQAMSEAGQRVDIAELEGNFDVLVLIDAYDDPADPAQMQEQITNRIQQERYVTHRINLAQSIAKPLIGTLPEPAQKTELKPTVPVLAASAVAGAIFGLVFAMYFSWVRNARLCRDALEKASLGDYRPPLRNHPTFVKAIVYVLVLILLAEIALGVLFGPAWVRTLEVLAAFGGCVLLGIILGLLIWRSRQELTDKTAPGKLRWARRRSLIFTVLLLVGGGLLALRPAPVIGVVDYLLSTVS